MNTRRWKLLRNLSWLALVVVVVVLTISDIDSWEWEFSIENLFNSDDASIGPWQGFGAVAVLTLGILGFWAALKETEAEKLEEDARNEKISSALGLLPYDRVRQVRDKLAETTRLLVELEDDLATRTEILDQLQADAEQYERLASLNKEQANSIQELINRQLRRQQQTNIWHQIAFLIPAFLLGFVVNWLSVPLLQLIKSAF